MDCKECAEDLTAYLDGELSPTGSKRVQAHLDSCHSCSDELQSLRETADFIHAHTRDLEPRPRSFSMIRARIAAEEQPPSSWHWLARRWRFAAAALAVIAALTIGYLQYQQFERRNLDGYMTQYIQEREARINTHTILTGTEVNPQMENPYADNPFIEVKATVSGNPFR